jgi:serine/threonine protein kinase
MHDRRILHRDVKLDNIMVIPPSRTQPFPIVKIIDFNLAAFYNPTFTAVETVGCIHYSSPWICKVASEAASFAANASPVPPSGMHMATVGVASDIWALGVSVFGALQGYFPFRSLTVETLGAELATTSSRREPGKRLTYPTPLSAACRHFLETAMNPAHPTTAYALLCHPWMAPCDIFGKVFPILARQGSETAGRHTLPSPWDAVIPVQAVDDGWYPFSLISAAARTSGYVEDSELARKEEERCMEISMAALAGIAERQLSVARAAREQVRIQSEARAAYPSPPVPEVVVVQDQSIQEATETEEQNKRWLAACPSPTDSFCAASDAGRLMPTSRQSSFDSGYASGMSSDFNSTMESTA